MREGVRETLSRLRSIFSVRAEDAYEHRDAAGTPEEHAYAEGEAHAYGVASDQVREAEEASRDPDADDV